MAKAKLEVYQIDSESGKTYIIYRYFDDKNNNYEYQTYQLVQSKTVARDLGISDTKEGRKSILNAREMCNEIIKNLENK
jgi:hypothetical protein